MHRFWDDFRGSGNVKNEQKRGRVALFLIFGVCNIRRRFGAVLEGSGDRLWELFNLQNRVFWASKSVSKKRQILKPLWHRVCDDFAEPGNVKKEPKRGRVALFLISGVCKMSAVLERF